MISRILTMIPGFGRSEVVMKFTQIPFMIPSMSQMGSWSQLLGKITAMFQTQIYDPIYDRNPRFNPVPFEHWPFGKPFWLVVDLPLRNVKVSQWEGWQPIYEMENNPAMFQTINQHYPLVI